MLAIRFAIDGESQVQRLLDAGITATTDLRPAWREIIDDFHQLEAEQFGGGGIGPSGAWVALSPRYAAWKARMYPGAPLMVRTGRLQASLTGGGGDSVTEILPLSMTVGSAVPYAGYHQRGGRMPRRALIDIPAIRKDRRVRIVVKYIQDRMRSGR